MYRCAEENNQLDDTLWNKLFLKNNEAINKLSAGDSDGSILALVRLLIPSKWVIDRRFGVGPHYLNRRYQERYEYLPASENKAKIYRDKAKNKTNKSV